MTDEEIARITAQILGPSSGASRALAEAARRRTAGEFVEVFNYRNTWLVGPPTASATALRS